MAINSIKIVIPIVRVKYGINQDLSRSQKDHKDVEIDVCVGNCSTEATVDHVGEQDQEGDQ